MPISFSLIDSFKNYQPVNDKEKIDLAAMISFLQSGINCFDREHLPGHFTGSALLINQTGDKVLLNHHKATNSWMQFGGHADGDINLFAVARRELEEESGFTNCESVISDIFDVDIHAVPYRENKSEPAHLHYDVRFIFRLQDDNEHFKISDESLELRWCSYEEAISLTGEGSFVRMLNKWRRLR